MDETRQRHMVLTISIFLGVGLLAWFLAELANSVDRAQALGNVLGGAIGALGAGVAVYVTLSREDAKQGQAGRKLKHHVELALFRQVQAINAAREQLIEMRDKGARYSSRKLSRALLLPFVDIAPATIGRFAEEFPAESYFVSRYMEERDNFFNELPNLARTEDLSGIGFEDLGDLPERLDRLAIFLALTLEMATTYKSHDAVISELRERAFSEAAE